MAQLKDTIVNGGLRATESIASPIGQFDTIYAKEKVSTGISENYTPGTNGQILQSKALNENDTITYWASLSPIIDLTQGTSENGPKIGATIAGVSTVPNNRTEINIATTNIYGVTKLTGLYNASTPNGNLAATGEAIKNAIDTLNSNIPDSSNPNLEIAGANKTLTALSIQSGKINAATFTEIAIDSSQITSGIGRNTILYGDSTGVIQSAAPAWGNWDNGTAAGPQAKIQIGAITYTSPAIPAASTSVSGIVTTEAQSFIGNKSFYSIVDFKAASGEGGEIHLNASDANTSQAGIVLDVRESKFRVFGIASADGTTITGVGTPLEIDPYSKTITGGYTLTGSLTGHASLDLPLTGGTMTGKITFNNVVNAIAYTGTKATYDMIKFKDNPDDTSGNGIIIGGGGLVCVGGGESANTVANGLSGNGGAEQLCLSNDGTIDFYTNCQNGFSSAVHTTINTSGNFSGNAANVTGTVAIDHGGTGATTAAKARQNLFGTSMADTAEYFITINTNWATGGYVTNAKAAEIIRSNASGSWSITAANVPWTGITGKHFYHTDTTSDWASYPWHQVASATITGNYQDYTMSVLVTCGCDATKTGILNVRLRSNGSAAFESQQIYWTTIKNINNDDFWLCYTTSTKTAVLWCRIDSQYNGYKFTVLENGDRYSGQANSWTMKASVSGHGSAAYSGNTNNRSIGSFEIGASTTDHATALHNYFNSYKSVIPRNTLTHYYSSTSGNGSVYMGYFLQGYDTAPYGGFFVAHYTNPFYVGISNGTYTQQHILTSTNYTTYTVTKTGSGASGSWGINVTGSSTGVTKRLSLTKGTNPSSTQWQYLFGNYQTGTGTAVTDRIGGYIESSIDANGATTLQLHAYQYTSGSSSRNTISINIAKDGTCSYSVSNAAAFRTAIGAGTSSLTIGTTSTTARAGLAPKSGAWFAGTPIVESDGVTEVGKYLDFHSTNAGTSDYDARITASTTGLTLSGTTTGTFSGSLTGNATTMSYPQGFSTRGSGETWGSTTGTGITNWGTSSGGCIAFRNDNPSTGKLSVKVDGRFYGNEGTYPAMLMRYENNYWGLCNPDAANDVWIRTTSSGIIPFQSGGAGSGHSGLGTSSWYFSYAYVDSYYGNWKGAAILVANGGTGATTPAGARSNLKANLTKVTVNTISTNSNGNHALSGYTADKYVVVAAYFENTTNRIPILWVYYETSSSVGQWEIKLLSATDMSIIKNASNVGKLTFWYYTI